MHLIDITHFNKDSIESDFMLCRYSYDVKKKCIDYINDYLYANHSFKVNVQKLDEHFDDYFNLQYFLRSEYNEKIEDDFTIKIVNNFSNNSGYLKSVRGNSVDIFCFSSSSKKNAENYMNFLIMDNIIEFLGENDELDKFSNISKDIAKSKTFNFANIYFEKQTLFLDDYALKALLDNNDMSKYKDKEKRCIVRDAI